MAKAQRTAAKAVNFGNLYGQQPAGLARTAKLSYGAYMTAQETASALNAFHTKNYQLSVWKRQQIGLGRRYRKGTHPLRIGVRL